MEEPQDDTRSCEALKKIPTERVISVGKDNDGVNDMTPFQVSSPSSCFNDVVFVEREDSSNVQISPSSNTYVDETDKMAVENNDIVMGSPLQISPSDNDNLATNRGSEEDVACAFVKFLMSRNVSVDVIQDAHFKSFLAKVACYGLPLSFVQENSMGIIERSLSSFAQGGNLYMQRVKESWKTTGCTMMFYEFDRGNNNNHLVVGFYCPKGFIFVEVDESASYYSFTQALKDHVLNVSMSDVTKYIDHSSSHLLKCHHQARRVTDEFESGFYQLIEDEQITMWESCIRHRIHELCTEICEKSKWVQSLISKSDKIHQYIMSSDLYGKHYKTLMQEGVEQFVDGKHASSLSRLRAIMVLEQKLICWLSSLSEYQRFNLENETDISAIIKNYEFWYDGNELLEALNALLKIPKMMDTLVPTAGYLYMAMDKAKCALKTYYDRRSMKYSSIWYSFKRWLDDDAFLDPLQSGAAYLTPHAYLLSEVEWDLKPTEFVKMELKKFLTEGADEETLDAEIKGYNLKSYNPFARISVSECRANHPLKLWSAYGSHYPILQKCAIKILSQPVSCLCKQVQKHVSQLQGQDNFVLRLNYKMMEEFGYLGDDIYKPIDF